MNITLKGKVALVTGGGSQVGFGRGIARVLAEAGCDVIVTDIDLPGARQTAAEVEALGVRSLAIEADITKIDQVKKMVATALEKFDHIDILVNNAGRATTPMPFVDTPEENWEKVINLNIYGLFHVTKAVLPQMIKRKSGKIVNISSGAGVSGMPRCLHYGASKAAIIVFTRGLAKEVISSGINVNSVAPGVGDTNFMVTGAFPEGELQRAIATVPTGRSTTPQEIGEAVTYLCSEAASNIVGQTIFLDGGHSIR
jgi:NAD(P)-dependent dehydrogenase (short-subunit alcohol dehydrogenase family)